jgi:hypothetical protein
MKYFLLKNFVILKHFFHIPFFCFIKYIFDLINLNLKNLN